VKGIAAFAGADFRGGWLPSDEGRNPSKSIRRCQFQKRINASLSQPQKEKQFEFDPSNILSTHPEDEGICDRKNLLEIGKVI